MPSRYRTAFTLIELLVVVTIIVVLLALLTPALDRAIYQAELAVCAANLRGLASGAQIYAVDQRRFYPDRQTLKSVDNIQNFDDNSTTTLRVNVDDRPMLRPYIPMKLFNDPLVKKLDLDAPTPIYVLSSYPLWFGMNFRGPNGNTGMRRMGERVRWDNRYVSPPLDLRGDLRFELLACDLDFYADEAYGGDNWSSSSHPDSDGAMPLFVRDDSGVYSLYDNMAAPRTRGTVDLNYAHGDGAVERRDGVRAADERMTTVPYRANPINYPTWRLQLPKP